ncbi:MAG: STAS domain-containing protein [Thermodesulfobacteriota bacterium]
MLRIRETSEDGKTVILKLDGKLVDAWVADLEEICLAHKDDKNKIVVLDFSGVTFIDNKGVRMLENIKDEKIKIINCSLFIQTLLCKLKIGNKE